MLFPEHEVQPFAAFVEKPPGIRPGYPPKDLWAYFSNTLAELYSAHKRGVQKREEKNREKKDCPFTLDSYIAAKMQHMVAGKSPDVSTIRSRPFQREPPETSWPPTHFHRTGNQLRWPNPILRTPPSVAWGSFHFHRTGNHRILFGEPSLGRDWGSASASEPRFRQEPQAPALHSDSCECRGLRRSRQKGEALCEGYEAKTKVHQAQTLALWCYIWGCLFLALWFQGCFWRYKTKS